MSIRTVLIALQTVFFLTASPVEASTFSFTTQATQSIGISWPYYPGEIRGTLEFAPTPSSGSAYGNGMLYIGAGTMTLDYVGNAPNGKSDSMSFNLFAQEGYTDALGTHDYISFATAAAPSNAHPYADYFSMQLYGNFDFLGGEDFGSVISALTSSASLNNIVKAAGYLHTTSYGSAVVYGNTTELSTSGQTLSSVPVPAAAWLFGSGLIGLSGLVRLFRREKTVITG